MKSLTKASAILAFLRVYLRMKIGFMQNSSELLTTLQRRCAGNDGYCSSGGKHQHCSGKHAAKAAVYSEQMCRAFPGGAAKQLEDDGDLRKG